MLLLLKNVKGNVAPALGGRQRGELRGRRVGGEWVKSKLGVATTSQLTGTCNAKFTLYSLLFTLKKSLFFDSHMWHFQNK